MIQRFVREVYMILVYMNTLCMMHFYKKNIYNSERVRIIISKLEKVDKIIQTLYLIYTKNSIFLYMLYYFVYAYQSRQYL